MNEQFAPTPKHGAAYRRVIEALGGTMEIGNCTHPENRSKALNKLDRIKRWASAQPPDVRDAYMWGIERTLSDVEIRYAVGRNSRAVAAAYDDLPAPPDVEKKDESA